MKFIAVNEKLLISAEDIIAIEDVPSRGEIITLRGGKSVEVSGLDSRKVKDILKDHELILTRKQ